MILKLNDKRNVIIVSFFHDGALQYVTAKPIATLDYNNNMGKLAGITPNFKITHERPCKYCQKLFRDTLDMVCLNAHILYIRKKGGRMSWLEFQLTD